MGLREESGLSVLVPVFNGSRTLEELVTRTIKVLSGVYTFEIVLIDDGSSDNSWDIICELAGLHSEVRGLRLRRNFGQHNALLAGLTVSKFSISVTVDDDLQNPPEEIPNLVCELSDSRIDVVYGLPYEVKQGAFRRAGSKLNGEILRRALGVSKGSQISSFRAFRTNIRQGLSGMAGPNVSLDALLSWGAQHYRTVGVSHNSRKHGKSGYTFRRLFVFSLDTFTGYSTLPLRLASVLGLVMALFGVFILMFVLLRPLFSGETVAGFPFLASIIAIFAGTQLISLGIIGEYLGRMHFRIMGKPTYLIAEASDK